MTSKREKYGAFWNPEATDIEIELAMIRRGGKLRDANGAESGNGLFFHYQQAQKLLWPTDDHHRWSELTLGEIIGNTITVLMGPGDSNKTYSAAKYALTDYFAFPQETCTLVSSTDVRGLELRVWGTIKDLFNRALERYDFLPGVPLESVHAITSDDVDEDDRARVLKKGIICIPCLAGGRFIGLGKYVGIKQKRVRLISDECQLMGGSFLDAVSNLMGNVDFKGIFMGNPLDPLDPLGRASEPEEGWESMPEPTKTTVWKTRFKNGKCVNLVGTDSPNFDYPPDKPIRYPYLISRRKIEEVAAFWGRDSLQYYSQCIGVMKVGMLGHRVITKALCREHGASEAAIWLNTTRTKIYAIDAAYRGEGGDRCVGILIEFGPDASGKEIMRVNPPVVIPVSMKAGKEPEDQIAEYVKNELRANNVPIENCFYDSTGRGTLGSAFARVFGSVTPVPVEFGGRPTGRPVRHDLFIDDDGERRHKRCDEHYSKFVTELWFSVRYVIECGQMRELPEDVMLEGCMREYGIVAGNKIELETKDDTKDRMGRSPDLFDGLVTAVEGARQRGFKIQRLGAIQFTEDNSGDWLKEEEKEYADAIRSALLTHQ